jgi:hypothetical protein
MFALYSSLGVGSTNLLLIVVSTRCSNSVGYRSSRTGIDSVVNNRSVPRLRRWRRPFVALVEFMGTESAPRRYKIASRIEFNEVF